MSEDWNTKYGTRRVRRDPPTLDEAIFAAIGITDDQQAQAEIAASLMGLPIESVTAEVRKVGRTAARSSTRVIAGEQGAQRTLRREACQQPLGGDKPVAGGARRFAGVLQYRGQFRRHIDRVRPRVRRLRQPFEAFLDGGLEQFGIAAGIAHEMTGETLGVVDQHFQQMLG